MINTEKMKKIENQSCRKKLQNISKIDIKKNLINSNKRINNSIKINENLVDDQNNSLLTNFIRSKSVNNSKKPTISINNSIM